MLTVEYVGDEVVLGCVHDEGAQSARKNVHIQNVINDSFYYNPTRVCVFCAWECMHVTPRCFIIMTITNYQVIFARQINILLLMQLFIVYIVQILHIHINKPAISYRLHTFNTELGDLGKEYPYIYSDLFQIYGKIIWQISGKT